MQEVLTVPATKEPVSLLLAKEYLRVTHSLEDLSIQTMISSARRMCEEMTRHSISPQRWVIQYRLPEWTCDDLGIYRSVRDPERVLYQFYLPRKPVQVIN